MVRLTPRVSIVICFSLALRNFFRVILSPVLTGSRAPTMRQFLRRKGSTASSSPCHRRWYQPRYISTFNGERVTILKCLISNSSFQPNTVSNSTSIFGSVEVNASQGRRLQIIIVASITRSLSGIEGFNYRSATKLIFCRSWNCNKCFAKHRARTNSETLPIRVLQRRTKLYPMHFQSPFLRSVFLHSPTASAPPLRTTHINN